MTRESDIERYLVKIAKSYGGEVRKVKWVGRDGAPDRLVMLPSRCSPAWQDPKGRPGPGGKLMYWGGGRVTPAATLWVELKRPGGKAKFPSNPHERKQAREHERMRRMGQRVEVIDSYEGVDALFI